MPTSIPDDEAQSQLQKPSDGNSDSDTESTQLDSSDEDNDVADSDSDYEPLSYVRSDGTTRVIHPGEEDVENIPEVNIPLFLKIINSKRRLREEEEQEEEEEDAEVPHEDRFDFPPDPENWQEEDLKELWADAPFGITKPGWDPKFVDDEELEIIKDEARAGREPPIAPFYVPYRKHYPVIPNNNYDISNPKSVIEELDRTEEFLTWVSYIFANGNSYEGTVWDDKAHGKGVLVAEQGLVRYEGEWLQNTMEGHGVVEVEIPTIEPIPGSQLEAKMRAEGYLISRDFLSPEDREWLEMDIEDSVQLADGDYEIPFYENDEWIKQFGGKPEKGRYRYAGQWKHGRMHGCGVYEVNERTTFGRFYFGELLTDLAGCDAKISGMHAGIAEVAAAKARMFVNKPDGMVREQRGPYSDPQHPYLYEEDDVWMAPGFINQFYEVPDYWKMYVQEVDQEREMWLNSFYRAPLRLPMPAELEHWWSKDEEPEFVLINKEPEPDPEDPTKLVYADDPLILHTPTGRIINYVDDEEHGIRLFWQPLLKEGEAVDPEKAEFLPLGFDEFYGRNLEVEDNAWIRFLKGVQNTCRSLLDKSEKWAEEKKKASEARRELLRKERDLVQAELSLKEAMEELDEELKRLQKEEENKVEQVVVKEENKPVNDLEKTPPEIEEENEEDSDDDDDDVAPSSFGSIEDQNSSNGNRITPGKSTFAASSLLFTFSTPLPSVPSKLQNSFIKWKELNFLKQKAPPSISQDQILDFSHQRKSWSSVRFPLSLNKRLMLRHARQATLRGECIQSASQMRCNRRRKSSMQSALDSIHFNVLSLHTPITTDVI